MTTADGTASAYFVAGGKAGNYVVSVTSPVAPGVTRTFTITATSSPDPLDSASREKNLGVDPGANGACADATRAITDHPINIATGNKLREESDYLGAGPFPLRFTRYYNSLGSRQAQLGRNWRSTYDRRVVVSSTTVKNKTNTVAETVRPDGKVLRYTLGGGRLVCFLLKDLTDATKKTGFARKDASHPGRHLPLNSLSSIMDMCRISTLPPGTFGFGVKWRRKNAGRGMNSINCRVRRSRWISTV